jgi:hypothetical protein
MPWEAAMLLVLLAGLVLWGLHRIETSLWARPSLSRGPWEPCALVAGQVPVGRRRS